MKPWKYAFRSCIFNEPVPLASPVRLRASELNVAPALVGKYARTALATASIQLPIVSLTEQQVHQRDKTWAAAFRKKYFSLQYQMCLLWQAAPSQRYASEFLRLLRPSEQQWPSCQTCHACHKTSDAQDGKKGTYPQFSGPDISFHHRK